MKIVQRKPDFKALYPTKNVFLASHEGKGALRKDAKSPIAGREGRAGLRSATIPGMGRDLPKHFNARALSHEILASGGFRIVDGARGRIENLLITPPGRRPDRCYVRHYRSLIDGLGPNRMYTVVCHPDAVDEISSWFGAHSNIRLQFVLSPRFNYTIWAQDAYVSATNAGGKTTLIEGIAFTRSQDMTLADDIAAQTDVSVLQSLLYFQGGNVLGGQDYTLIGNDYVWKNTTRFSMPDEAAVISEFEAAFGTKLIVLGKEAIDYDYFDSGVFSGLGTQPLFHIDMYVTRTGVKGSSGKEIVLLGRPRAVKDALSKSGRTDRYCETPVVDGPRLDSFFEKVEEQLQPHFEVHHLPLCLTFGDLGYRESPQYYWLTFNNVVIENAGEGHRKVLMPTYSGDAETYDTDATLRKDLEEAAADKWRRLGFSVHFMDALEDLAYGSGSVHCITKDLLRSQPAR